MLEELNNKSKIEIEIKTKFSKQMLRQRDWDDEDITYDCEKAFHEAVFKWIENKIIDNEDFEQEILEILTDNQEIIEGIDEFCKLGQIGITLGKTESDISKEKQEELA